MLTTETDLKIATLQREVHDAAAEIIRLNRVRENKIREIRILETEREIQSRLKTRVFGLESQISAGTYRGRS